MSEKREKLEKRLKGYQRGRLGCIIFTVISILFLILFIAFGGTDEQMVYSTYYHCFIWPALAYIAHLKTRILRMKLNLCYRCGYDLRGTSEQSHCPECGYSRVIDES